MQILLFMVNIFLIKHIFKNIQDILLIHFSIIYNNLLMILLILLLNLYEMNHQVDLINLIHIKKYLIHDQIQLLNKVI